MPQNESGGAKTLLVEQIGRIARVTLNRPESINAFDDSIRCALPKAMLEADQNPDIAAIVLSGAGNRGFCVGADLKESHPALSPVDTRRRLMPDTWIESLDLISKPIIAVLHGLCLGGGAELALACDIRVAASNTWIGLPETLLGLIPGGGGTQRLTRLIGLGPALDVLLTGERLSAQRAWQLGLVTRLADSFDEAMSESMRVAGIIADRPPTAIAYCKEAVRVGSQVDLQSGLRLEKSLFALLTSTTDHAEALAAFRDKRPPHFTGR